MNEAPVSNLPQPLPSKPAKVSDWEDRRKQIVVYLLIIGLSFAALTVYLWPYLRTRIFVSLDSGQAGVLWERFLGGTNVKYIYGEGFHLIAPWNRLYVYNTRLQQTPHTITALCKNGLSVEVGISIRYRPEYSSLPLLHKIVGPEYVETLVKPEVEAVVRTIVAQFEPAVLSGSEGYVADLIVQGAKGEVSDRYVELDDVLVKQIILPALVRDAVQAKLVEEQRAEEYQYRIRQAEQEAARKAIEAKGIRDFQEAVTNRGDFKDYLRYTGIQASLELAKSNNSKIVVFGGPAGGLPLIFNAEADRLDAAKPAAPHAEAEATPTPPKPATATSPNVAKDKPRANSTQ